MSISYNKYLKYKKDVEKSYADKMSNVRKGSFLFSYFGNILSIFFAYFFFIALFSSTLFNVNQYLISGIIVFFLSLFEYIKRYVFDIFSIQLINTKNVFKKSNISFLLMTLILIGFSFFFSLSGAKKLVNKQNIIITEKTNLITVKKDSIINYYNTEKIKPLIEENEKYFIQRQEYSNNLKIYIDRKWSTKDIDKQIRDVDKLISKNKEKISEYEKQMNDDITELKTNENSLLNSDTQKNSINIIYFVSFSLLIELIIMFGIYYNRKFEFIVKTEYEKKIMNTTKFKKWNLSNIILTMLADTDVKVGEHIPSTESLLELIKSSDINISKKELTDILKVFNSLKIIETRGSRRYLKTDIIEAKSFINNYYKIK